MGAKITAAAVSIALVSTAGSACAMNPQTSYGDKCRVVDAGKLPPQSGGAEALCTAIDRAAAAGGLEGFAVEVRVLSPSMLVAVMTMPDGRRLPEQRLATADRQLRQSSFERFARSLVELAQAERR